MPSVVYQDSNIAFATAVSTLSTSVTAGGDNRIGLVLIAAGYVQTESTVHSYAGIAGDRLFSFLSSSDKRTEAWLVKNPATGAQNATATFSASRDELIVAAYALSGVDLQTPIRDVISGNSGTGTGTSTPDQIISTMRGDTIIGFLHLQNNGGDITADNGGVNDEEIQSDFFDVATARWESPNGGPVQVGFAWTGAIQFAWGFIVVRAVPALGEGAATTSLIESGDEDDFLAELRGQWFDPLLIIEKWFDEDLEPAAAGGSDMSATGSLSINGAADLDATGSLLAAGVVSIVGAADLDAVGSLAAAGAVSINGAADLDAIGQLLAAGSIFITGAADLTSPATNDIAATGSLSITGAADLDALGNLLAAGALGITGLADLTSGDANDLDAVGTVEITGLASLTALGALIAAGSIVINGVADLSDGGAPAPGPSDWIVLARRRGRR